MITEEFRKSFKEDLGENFNYSPEVKKILAERGATNRIGKPYGAQSIRNVFNGVRPNRVIEWAIMECYNRELELISKHETLENDLNRKKLTGPDGQNS